LSEAAKHRSILKKAWKKKKGIDCSSVSGINSESLSGERSKTCQKKPYFQGFL